MKAILSLPLLLTATFSLASHAAGPVSDISTPERALQSYWEFVDWREKVGVERDSRYLTSPEHRDEVEKRNHVMSGERLKFEAQRDAPGKHGMYDRKIVEVKMVGTSRALLTTHQKNAIPLDTKAIDPSNLSREQRLMLNAKEGGELFQYTLEKQPDGWRVTEVSKRVYGDGIPAFDSILSNPAVPVELLKIVP